MTETTSEWCDLGRAEKIRCLFDYPASTLDVRVKDLWGPEAFGYGKHIYFPITASWNEIVAVIKGSRHKQTAYTQLRPKDFDVPDISVLRNGNLHYWNRRVLENEYYAFLSWRRRVLNDSRPEPLDFELYNDNTLVCRVCTEAGDRGDESGFGVEPDRWACALFDMDGRVIRPFVPGCLFA